MCRPMVSAVCARQCSRPTCHRLDAGQDGHDRTEDPRGRQRSRLLAVSIRCVARCSRLFAPADAAVPPCYRLDAGQDGHVRKIRAADSAPGVLGTLLGKTCFFYGVHEEERLNGPPGRVLARRDGAICIGTVDGAVWISHLKDKDEAQEVISLAQAGIGCEPCDAELYPVAGIK